MKMNRLDEIYLANIESLARDSGYDYPIAAAMEFIWSNQNKIREVLPELAPTLDIIIDWFENGDPNNREDME